jgi:hypothetical protein
MLEPLEPRVMLSAFPVIMESTLPHDTEATAQDLTAELVELSPGEGTWGAYVEGTTQPGGNDYYKVELTECALAASSIEYTGPGWAELGPEQA